jgi:hypothetical protein
MVLERLIDPYYDTSIPLMWKLIDVADAPPVITLVVASTCFRSMYAVELAAIGAVVCNAVPARPIVNVPAVPAVLVIAILVTIVVVEEGTVYRVVPTVVVAAPRNSALVVVAISYYLSFRGHP